MSLRVVITMFAQVIPKMKLLSKINERFPMLLAPTRKKLIGLAAFSASLVALSPAKAPLTFYIEESGANVVITGSGSVNTSELTQVPLSGSIGYALVPLYAEVGVGPTKASREEFSVRVLAGFGSGLELYADAISGDTFAYTGVISSLFLPSGYVSGTQLTGSATFDNASFADYGLTSGTSYTVNFGSGKDADPLTIDIGPQPSAVTPEPSSAALFSGVVLAFTAVLWRRQRRANA